MRILSPHCGLAAETTSGGEVFERELLRRLAAQHPVMLLMTRKALRKAQWPGLASSIRSRLPLTWWLAPLLLTEAMHEMPRPDLLRVHSLLYIGPAALYARRVFWPGVPIIAHHHHLDAGWHPIERYVSNHVDRVIVGSEFAKRQMAKRGWRTDHVRVVPYAVDERFKPVERSGRDGVVVLYLGGLKKRKNVELLLRIWPAVHEACPTARLVIAGSGPEEARLRRVAARRKNVSFLGYVLEADKPRVYQDADLFVFPSRMEGFGLPVLEAMASRLPVLVSENGSLPELVQFPDTCVDERAWRYKLTHMCQSGNTRRLVGILNAQRARNYSWDRCVRETLAVYEEVVR